MTFSIIADREVESVKKYEEEKDALDRHVKIYLDALEELDCFLRINDQNMARSTMGFMSLVYFKIQEVMNKLEKLGEIGYVEDVRIRLGQSVITADLGEKLVERFSLRYTMGFIEAMDKLRKGDCNYSFALELAKQMEFNARAIKSKVFYNRVRDEFRENFLFVKQTLYKDPKNQDLRDLFNFFLSTLDGTYEDLGSGILYAEV